jgi:hypothetical protein
MNKKIVFVFALGVLLAAGIISAQEDAAAIYRFHAGGGLMFGPSIKNGTLGEFGFLLYNKGWDIRNTLLIRSLKTDDPDPDTMLVTFSDKISIGTFTRGGLFRPYGFFEAGAGLYGHGNKEMTAAPPVFSIGIGGGIDILFLEQASIFIETGYLWHHFDASFPGSAIFQIGWRCHFGRK